jgi:hypothetical protein
MATPTRAATRLELHNAHIDDALALAGRCGNLHLPTGARCRLPARHRGGCDFVPEPGAAGSVRIPIERKGS